MQDSLRSILRSGRLVAAQQPYLAAHCIAACIALIRQKPDGPNLRHERSVGSQGANPFLAVWSLLFKYAAQHVAKKFRAVAYPSYSRLFQVSIQF